MRKAIIGLLALLTVAATLFAAPALSTSNGQEVTVKSLARQVRALRVQVNALRRQVASARAAAASAQARAGAAQGTATTAQARAEQAWGSASAARGVAERAEGIAHRLDSCLSRVLPVTRYSDVVGSDASVSTVYDPDVLGYVPVVSAGGTFGFTSALDLTNAGDSADYYIALVESFCTGGY